ncbi:MAG TPA: hypothetical protein VNE61_00105 [Ktedonobacteraceae bacterium]|nr:hypothetical protein [Ktedonobacteraceae bacterium]
MSDYISHIVELSMGIAASVQPRIVPMFAPPSFFAFFSLEDMIQQQQLPASAAAEAEEAPITTSFYLPEILSAPPPLPLVKAVQPQSLQDAGDIGRDDPLAGAINRPLRMEETLSQSQPKAERHSEQPSVQPLQNEPAPPSQALPIPEQETSRGVGLPRPLSTQSEQETSRGVGLPRPRNHVIQKRAGQANIPKERAGQAHAPTERVPDASEPASGVSALLSLASNQPMPVIPSMLPQPEIIARSDRGVQTRDSHPLDALVQQQSAFRPAPLLPGEVSPLASQSGEESARYAAGMASNERAPFAVLDESDELLSWQNSQKQSPAYGYDSNLASEPGAPQRLWTRSGRRDDDANESEPVIRVSIGRVEVRATTSPAAPVRKRAASTAPALSLSDYLKRRKGGTS